MIILIRKNYILVSNAERGYCLKAYLGTQLEIHHDDSYLTACYHKNDEDNEKEAEEIIELILPDCLERKRANM